VELKAESSTASGKDIEVRLNLFSSSEGGVLNPSKTPGENILSKVSLKLRSIKKMARGFGRARQLPGFIKLILLRLPAA